MVSILISILIIAYVLLVLALWLGWERAQPFDDIGDFSEPVSVIIAARNESSNIIKLLKDIECQNYSIDLIEVVIVDTLILIFVLFVLKRKPKLCLILIGKMIVQRDVLHFFISLKQRKIK